MSSHSLRVAATAFLLMHLALAFGSAVVGAWVLTTINVAFAVVNVFTLRRLRGADW